MDCLVLDFKSSPYPEPPNFVNWIVWVLVAVWLVAMWSLYL